MSRPLSRPVSCTVEKDHILIWVETEDHTKIPCIQLTVGSTWSLQSALEKAVEEALRYRRSQTFQWGEL